MPTPWIWIMDIFPANSKYIIGKAYMFPMANRKTSHKCVNSGKCVNIGKCEGSQLYRDHTLIRKYRNGGIYIVLVKMTEDKRVKGP